MMHAISFVQEEHNDLIVRITWRYSGCCWLVTRLSEKDTVWFLSPTEPIKESVLIKFESSAGCAVVASILEKYLEEAINLLEFDPGLPREELYLELINAFSTLPEKIDG